MIGLDYRHYLPAHGGAIGEGPAYARALLAHRDMRNSQVIAAVAAGATSLGELRRRIYPTLALPLRAAARMTLKAHVEYLADRGRIAMSRTVLGLRFSPARG